jgi:hypothetical protein
MARGRMINQSVATDKRLNGLTMQAELLYLKAIPHLDRDGLILGDPLVLWGKVCPRRPELMGEIADIIKEWVESELVISYDSEEGEVLFFVGFHKNQSGMRYDREGASTLPPPPGYVRTSSGMVPQENTPAQTDDGVTPELVRSNAGASADEVQSNSARVRAHARAEVEVKDQDQVNDPADAGRTDFLQARLQTEWVNVNKAQVEGHRALVERYGFEAWLRGFNTCKAGSRSNFAYVEKVILTELDKSPPNGKPPPKKRKFITDSVTGKRKEVWV